MKNRHILTALLLKNVRESAKWYILLSMVGRYYFLRLLLVFFVHDDINRLLFIILLNK